MDDEQEARISALFRDAASGAPPAAFDSAQVVAASRRITRRRSAVAGAALAVLAVAGVGVVAGLGGPGDATVTAASGQAADDAATSGSGAGSEGAARAAAPEAGAAPEMGGTATGSPLAPAAPDGSPPSAAAAVPPVGTPLGPGTGDCADRQDPALRALVEQVLPEVVGAPAAATTMECRPGGERGVALEAGGGVLTVTYLPPGPVEQVGDGARAAPTASGGTVVASSRASRAGDPEPFADRLDTVLTYLAPRL
jgi:hypothetical protein